jgi:hypothetical protein
LELKETPLARVSKSRVLYHLPMATVTIPVRQSCDYANAKGADAPLVVMTEFRNILQFANTGINRPITINVGVC